MASLAQQLSKLAAQLTNLRDSIPVDNAVVGVVLEQHSPGNGRTYPRLRSPRGKTLANGKRTMSLKPSDVEKWEQKIYARNQQAEVAQCLALMQQAAEVAGAITWNFGEAEQLVNDSKETTKVRKKPVASSTTERPKITIKYVLKDAKGATTINRKVHAISQAQPDYGRW